MRIVALIVAILLGIAAAVGIKTYLNKQERSFEKKHKPESVAIAKHTIKTGEYLEATDIMFREIPAKSLSPDLITRSQLSSFIGRKVQREIGEDMEIRRSHFVERGLPTAAGRLGQGKRALTVAVDVTSGVAGLVRPGDRVDVYATSTAATSGAAGAAKETWLVLNNVHVLATDTRLTDVPFGGDRYRQYKKGYSTLTLSVTPEEAQLLTYLQDNAKLTFTLRSYEEAVRTRDEWAAPPPVTSADVRKRAEKANVHRHPTEIPKKEKSGSSE
ncbi:MAG: Flp pilus assembly protein CpaB [Candidatus Brocadiia bacterium]